MAERVHARFYVQSHTRTTGFGMGGKDMADQFDLYGVKGEPFGSATPSASMKMAILNPEAAKLFIEALETRRNVDVIFSLAPEQE